MSAERHVLYHTKGRIAYVTLNRPSLLNAISEYMPHQLRLAVEEANADDSIHVIILQGSGTSFCSGYDLKAFAEAKGPRSYSQGMPWDPLLDFNI